MVKNIDSAFRKMVCLLVKSGTEIQKSQTPSKMNLIHMALGVAGEAGEIVDAIKKFTMYNKPLNEKNLIEELGDMEFYMQEIRNEIGVTRDQVLQANMDKLLTGKNARYAEGIYSDEQAIARADKDGENAKTQS